LLVISETEEQKTLTIKSAITSLSYRKKPENLGLIIIDSTPSALNVFKNSQNLIHPIIKEKSEAIKILEWAKLEMDARIKQHRSKSATQDQSAIKPEHDKSGIPEYIIIVINELADLMVHNPSETELLIATLGQQSSRIGIHLIIATTHQNYDVLTGLILANYPSKIIFKPLSKFIGMRGKPRRSGLGWIARTR
jgi:DNA segregation ATPase FtsK/SpoIIIE-like protein